MVYKIFFIIYFLLLSFNLAASKCGIYLNEVDLIQLDKYTGGSTGGQWYRDETGKLFYLKKDVLYPELQTAAEVMSSMIYSRLGYKVPEAKIVSINGERKVMISEIENVVEHYSDFRNFNDYQTRKLRVVAAFLKDWDRLGNPSNNLILQDGSYVLIDFGGTFGSRARGRFKPGKVINEQIGSFQAGTNFSEEFDGFLVNADKSHPWSVLSDEDYQRVAEEMKQLLTDEFLQEVVESAKYSDPKNTNYMFNELKTRRDLFISGLKKYTGKAESDSAEYGEKFFTDPKSHNDEGYNYLVHGIYDDNRAQKRSKSKGIEFDNSKSLYSNPNYIRKKGFLSTSIISENINSTFGQGGGYILRAPDKSVIGTWQTDFGTPHLNNPDMTLDEFYKLRGSNQDKKAPSEILSLTKPNNYNEVLLYSKNERQVTIEAVFISVLERNPLITIGGDKFAAQLKRNAKVLNVPVVYIKVKKEAFPEGPPQVFKINNWDTGEEYLTFTVNKGGYRYLINKYENNPIFEVFFHSYGDSKLSQSEHSNIIVNELKQYIRDLSLSEPKSESVLNSINSNSITWP